MDASILRELTLSSIPAEEAQAKLKELYDVYFAALSRSPD
jgi:hypothetical protein